MSVSTNSEPTVCAVMLTADRPALARRAVESFRAQTYPKARLCVFMNGGDLEFALSDSTESIGMIDARLLSGKSIGYLRNFVADTLTKSPKPPDMFVHWDSDDWSHPNRIAEQVALLQSSGADCVGYRDMLFWEERGMLSEGQAWLYSNHDRRFALGTSLCYWRKTWEAKPFEAPSRTWDGKRGEDRKFIRGLNCVGLGMDTAAPRMIARIHAGNAPNYAPELRRNSSSWKRVPEWDDYCRSIMEAA